MKKTHSRLTLEDIAKEIHISRTTIYKVLNQKGTVSEQTRQTVLDALKRYDYVPNNNARNLALNKNYTIGFIDFESPDAAYFAAVIEQGIRQAIQEYGDHGLEVHHYTAPIHQPKQQLLDLKKAFQSRIRHFVISAADPAQMHTALIKLAEAGCTVINPDADSKEPRNCHFRGGACDKGRRGGRPKGIGTYGGYGTLF